MVVLCGCAGRLTALFGDFLVRADAGYAVQRGLRERGVPPEGLALAPWRRDRLAALRQPGAAAARGGAARRG